MDGKLRVIEDGAVAVKQRRIVQVGSAKELKTVRARKQLDAQGKIIMPGLINTHTHIPMVLFRGLADDRKLMDWLQNYMWPAERKNVDEQFVRWGTKLGCLEMLRGGTTTYVGMYFFEDAIAEETAKCGMRANLAQGLIEFPSVDNKAAEKERWQNGMEIMQRFVKRWKGHNLITPAIGPHAPYTVSPKHLKAAHDFAVQHNIPLHIHLAETPGEASTIMDTFKVHLKSPVEYLARLGVLDRHVIAAHMVWTSASDIKLLKKHSVGIAHCPQSNMKLASGTASVPKMLEANIPVGLGTDGAASNNDLNLWEEMDTAAKLHKLVSKDATVIPAHQAVEMATIGGARAIHMEKDIGSIETGKLADINIVDAQSSHQIPSYDVYSQLVYSTKASDVESVIIDGTIVMKNCRLLTLNDKKIRKKAYEYRDRIAASTRN